MDEVTLGDKTYISSKRAAEITGYAKDYVGQLCREGHVDAKMVGRGWYVYESSIRRHRFGDPAEQTTEGPEETTNPVQDWVAPLYKAETPVVMPEIAAAAQPLELETSHYTELPEPEPLAPDSTLTDMQAAWREWFDAKRQEVPVELETPEIIGARAESEEVQEPEDEEEVAIPFHRMEEPEVEQAIEEEEYEQPEDQEEIVPIHRVQPAPPAQRPPSLARQAPFIPIRYKEQPQEARIIRERVVTRSGKNSRSNAPITAVLVAISIIAVVVAVIGSGVADNYIGAKLGNNVVTKYLVGERVLNK